MYSFPNFESVCCSVTGSHCCFLACIQISQEASKVFWYSHLFKNFQQFIVIHTVKGFSIVSEAEVDFFPGTLLLFLWSSGCWQFDRWFSGIWKAIKTKLDWEIICFWGSFLDGISGKESACQCRRHKRYSFYPWIKKIPWRRAENSPQFYCLQNAMDRGAWWATAHRVTQSWTQLKRLSTHTELWLMTLYQGIYQTLGIPYKFWNVYINDIHLYIIT